MSDLSEESTGQMESSESASRIRALEAENHALRERLETARRALEFYATTNIGATASSTLRALDGEGE